MTNSRARRRRARALRAVRRLCGAGRRGILPNHPGRRTAALALAATAGVVAATLPGAVSTTAEAASPYPHGMGLLLPTARVSAATGLNSLAQAADANGGALMGAGALPGSVDLTSYAVPPGNQGNH